MACLNTLEIPDDLYAQIKGMAQSQARSIDEQVLALIEKALAVEKRKQHQSNILSEIYEARWTPTQSIPDSVELIRENRGYDS